VVQCLDVLFSSDESEDDPALGLTPIPKTYLPMLQAIIRRPLIPSETPPILVLLHGLGADEHDLMGLASELDARLLVVSLRAPLEYGPTGFAWFQINWDADGIHVDASQVLASRELLINTLKSLPEAVGAPASPLFLAGFSQGAMMSLGVALEEPALVKGVVCMSGRLVPEFLPPSRPSEVAKVPFLVQHGTGDDILPVTGSQLIRDCLEAIGCTVTYREYPMRHEIGRQSLADIRDWLDEHLPAAF